MAIQYEVTSIRKSVIFTTVNNGYNLKKTAENNALARVCPLSGSRRNI